MQSKAQHGTAQQNTVKDNILQVGCCEKVSYDPLHLHLFLLSSPFLITADLRIGCAQRDRLNQES